MKLKVAQVIGLNTDQKAAQVISTIQDGNAFFAVLELSCDDAFTKGRQALSELSDYYFDFEASPSEKLTQTFAEAEKKFGTDDFSLFLSSVSGKILYIISKGMVAAYLKRVDKLSSLLSSSSPQLISGFLEEEDRLLFATKSLVDFLDEDLSKAMQIQTDAFEDEITARLGTATLQKDGVAGLIVEVEKTQQEEVIPNITDEEEDQPQEYPEAFGSASKLILIKEVIHKAFKKLLFLRTYFPKSNRGRLILAVVLIVILTGGAGYKYKTSKDKQKDAQFSKFLSSAKDDFNAAKSLSTLSPADAKLKLDSAKDEINKALALKAKNTEGLDLKKQIEENEGSILQQVSISQFPLFLDMDLVKKNFRAEKLSMSSGKLLLMDPAVKTLVAVDISKKSNQILAGDEQLGDGKSFSLNGGMAFVYSKEKGVLRIDTTKQSLTSSEQKLTTVAKADSDLGQIADIYAFAGNVYLLDTGKNKIWKYLPTSDSYSDKREYLTSDTGGGSATKVDLSNSLRMQIESSVYILKQGGEIVRFTRGVKDNFSIGGLDKGVKDPKSFFVSSDTDNLYLLDSGNSRLLILTKTGGYKGTISGDKFGSASDLVVDEQGKKVYLLDGSKIYTVDLK